MIYIHFPSVSQVLQYILLPKVHHSWRQYIHNGCNGPRKIKINWCGSNLHIHEVPKSSSRNVRVWRRRYLPVECCTLMNSNDPLMHSLLKIQLCLFKYSQCQVWIFTISGMNIYEVHPVASAFADDPMNNDCLLQFKICINRCLFPDIWMLSKSNVIQSDSKLDFHEVYSVLHTSMRYYSWKITTLVCFQ